MYDEQTAQLIRENEALRGELSRAKYPKVADGEIVTPSMDGYLMKCCGCDLVHKVMFRAIRVTATHPDGTFAYDDLDPKEYRVEMVAEQVARRI